MRSEFPSHLSHYEILEKLGEGGMGVVYKARDTRLGRTVALKFLPAAMTGDSRTRERFVNEARAASALDHHNICTIHEIDESEDGRTFIAMACYEGETLKRKMGKDPLKLEEAVDIAAGIAQGLARAHRKGIIHRDIKPANIFITEDGVAKILDFGLAKLEGQSMRTKEGATLGTPAYMSPEQAGGKGVDARTDIWSLGVIIYEMVSGTRPFRGEYDQAMIYSILHDEPADIRKSAPGIPDRAVKLIKKALARNPARRYQSAEEMIDDLRTVKVELDRAAPPGVTDRRERSIAVLPFVDMSPQGDQEYFCDGLAEELMNALTNVKPLRVAARTSAFSFRGGDRDVREIGEKLNVEVVLEGSIRKAGNRLRITAQLINAENGFHIWSERYDREMKDIFAIQDEISLAIVDQLSAELLGDEAAGLLKRGTEDIEAYDLYMRGMFFWEKRGTGLLKAIEFFKQAIARDPGYARPYAGIADCYNLLSFWAYMPSREAVPVARENAVRALQLDETIAEAHSSLGWIHAFYDWDPKRAVMEFERAIELNPSYTPAHYWYSAALLAGGRIDEALRENEKAIEVDPLSVQAHTQYGMTLIVTHEYEKSISRLERALALNPHYPIALWLIGWNYFMTGRLQDGLSSLRRAVDVSGRSPWMLSMLGFVYGRMGEEEKARAILSELMERSREEYVQALRIAYVLLGLNQLDEAMEWLNRSYEDRDQYLIAVVSGIDPASEEIRDDPRLKQLAAKVMSGAGP